MASRANKKRRAQETKDFGFPLTPSIRRELALEAGRAWLQTLSEVVKKDGSWTGVIGGKRVRVTDVDLVNYRLTYEDAKE